MLDHVDALESLEESSDASAHDLTSSHDDRPVSSTSEFALYRSLRITEHHSGIEVLWQNGLSDSFRASRRLSTGRDR